MAVHSLLKSLISNGGMLASMHYVVCSVISSHRLDLEHVSLRLPHAARVLDAVSLDS